MRNKYKVGCRRLAFALGVLVVFPALAWDETLAWKYDESGRSAYVAEPHRRLADQSADIDLRQRVWNSLCSVWHSGLSLILR